MGTDILEHYERFQNGHWEAVDFLKCGEGPSWSHPASVDRNYNLFGILSGFRSLYTVTPIARYRGLPPDVSSTIAARWAAVAYDDCLFGLSWVGLDELLAFDWEQIMTCDDLTGYPPLTCREAAGRFYEVTLPYLRAQVDDPAHLRMVFWFGF
ncbi:hypothetical protein [Deinococcus soli (ex Cha et al. 2016)]|uniref:Uncharacterized protein n=2 Tax=Deinococcus soli (ex Cha et al. 2016) TaxID=1309411 RepID=A0AAE3X9A6_9DEIO|nr:hypothetical protein [Deinococcus soli (ex Cha et al. 2016)]MDR6216624.1 hypothetical protein [Deinococcus soli (ex Cha et al. 2016)]MDR6327445.1 hypothetical protein [Deinococcus soli (ex Cha et al. 2016)]MDR6749720.1 hypothetical protein [Deinococcus soli (ex Cha et al. 2016)]